jgi:hypothetical protein
MCHRDFGTAIETKRAQPLTFVLGQHSPIDRGNTDCLTNREGIERHHYRAARTGTQLQVIRNS